MAAPHEVVRSPVPWSELPAAAAWLLGYVRTDAPGYREVDDGGFLRVVPNSTGYRFDDYFDAVVATMLQLSPWEWQSTGRVVGTSADVRVMDRLMWVLGFGGEVGETVDDLRASQCIPPAGIPLLGAKWTRVESAADRQQISDRFRRNQGYVWGGALIYRCTLKMHRWALEALMTGWCLRGKVTLGFADMLDTPISSSEPRGAITGYALGLGGVSWPDRVEHTAIVEYYIVTE